MDFPPVIPKQRALLRLPGATWKDCRSINFWNAAACTLCHVTRKITIPADMSLHFSVNIQTNIIIVQKHLELYSMSRRFFFLHLFHPRTSHHPFEMSAKRTQTNRAGKPLWGIYGVWNPFIFVLTLTLFSEHYCCITSSSSQCTNVGCLVTAGATAAQ